MLLSGLPVIMIFSASDGGEGEGSGLLMLYQTYPGMLGWEQGRPSGMTILTCWSEGELWIWCAMDWWLGGWRLNDEAKSL